jgi:hypothetical protein
MSKGQGNASRNMKLVATRSKSKHEAGQQETPKEVEKRDKSKCKKETKANGKMR